MLTPTLRLSFSQINRGVSSISNLSKNLPSSSRVLKYTSNTINPIRYFSSATTNSISRSRVTIEQARAMPTEWSHMSNDELLGWCGSQGVIGANEERVIRNIMAVEGKTWEEVQPTIVEMRTFLTGECSSIYKYPYQIGLGTAVVAGVLSTPMIFERNTVKWFNERFVTMEVPPPGELDTWLEVGSWSWSWMEPCLGQASFLILCAQFGRNQMLNLGIKPYTNWIQSSRANKLVAKYPDYNVHILKDYAKTFSPGDSSLSRETEVLARMKSGEQSGGV